MRMKLFVHFVLIQNEPKNQEGFECFAAQRRWVLKLLRAHSQGRRAQFFNEPRAKHEILRAPDSYFD